MAESDPLQLTDIPAGSAWCGRVRNLDIGTRCFGG